MATLFLALLDSGRFFGRNRDKDVSHQIEAADLMRRIVKEELVKFDGTPLFPERNFQRLCDGCFQVFRYPWRKSNNRVVGQIAKDADGCDRTRDSQSGLADFGLDARLHVAMH